MSSIPFSNRRDSLENKSENDDTTKDEVEGERGVERIHEDAQCPTEMVNTPQTT